MTISNKDIVLSTIRPLVDSLFLGGGQRFGWSYPNGDIDVFVLVQPAAVAILATQLRLTRAVQPGYPGIHMATTVFGQNVDVIIYTDPDVFEATRLSHDQVDAYLNKYPGMRSPILAFVTRAIARNVLTGTEAFETLLTLAHDTSADDLEADFDAVGDMISERRVNLDDDFEDVTDICETCGDNRYIYHDEKVGHGEFEQVSEPCPECN